MGKYKYKYELPTNQNETSWRKHPKRMEFSPCVHSRRLCNWLTFQSKRASWKSVASPISVKKRTKECFYALKLFHRNFFIVCDKSEYTSYTQKNNNNNKKTVVNQKHSWVLRSSSIYRICRLVFQDIGALYGRNEALTIWACQWLVREGQIDQQERLY